MNCNNIITYAFKESNETKLTTAINQFLQKPENAHYTLKSISYSVVESRLWGNLGYNHFAIVALEKI